MNAQQLDAAVETLARAAALPDYQDANGCLMLGQAYVQQKRYKEAVPVLEKATAWPPTPMSSGRPWPGPTSASRTPTTSRGRPGRPGASATRSRRSCSTSAAWRVARRSSDGPPRTGGTRLLSRRQTRPSGQGLARARGTPRGPGPSRGGVPPPPRHPRRGLHRRTGGGPRPPGPRARGLPVGVTTPSRPASPSPSGWWLPACSVGAPPARGASPGLTEDTEPGPTASTSLLTRMISQ